MRDTGMAFRLFLPILLAAAVAGELIALEIPLNMSESDGYTRRAENVSTGVLLPRGALTSLDRLALTARTALRWRRSSSASRSGRTALSNGCWWILPRTARPGATRAMFLTTPADGLNRPQP